MTNEETFSEGATGSEISVSAVHGAQQSGQQIRMGLPAITTAGEHVIIDVSGPCVLQKQGNALILTYALLKRHGYLVEWAEGTAKHPHFGGYLFLPDGRRIKLGFDNDLYYLP
eukprot:2263429-Rhodomonas_salina.1